MKRPPVRAALSNEHDTDDVERYSYTTCNTHVQVSRPSTLRTPAAASAAIALWQYDTRIWLPGGTSSGGPRSGRSRCCRPRLT